MNDGLWVHQIPRSGGATGVLNAAKRLGAKHIIIK